MMSFVIFLLVLFYLERTIFSNVSHPFTMITLEGGKIPFPPLLVLLKFLRRVRHLMRVSLLVKVSLSLSPSFLGMRN
jgi:hypothetical protein